MAATLRRLAEEANPLRLSGAAVPPQLVLIARTLAIVMALLRVLPFPRYLPYIELLDRLGSDAAFNNTLRAAVAVGFVVLLFTRFVRLGCFLSGAAYLTGLIACRPMQSVAHTFVACAFLIIAMSSEVSGLRLFRAQVVILYLGAVTNKTFDADWWNGRYFETFLVDRYADPFYMGAASIFPPMALSRFMGILTIATQAAIAVCFLRRRWFAHGALLGIVFHGIMTLMTSQTFGPFLAAILFSYIAFFPWPDHIAVSAARTLPQRWLHRFLTRTDFDRRFQVTESARKLKVSVLGQRYEGMAAAGVLALNSPLFYFLVASVLASRGIYAFVTVASVCAVAIIARAFTKSRRG